MEVFIVIAITAITIIAVAVGYMEYQWRKLKRAFRGK